MNHFFTLIDKISLVLHNDGVQTLIFHTPFLVPENSTPLLFVMSFDQGNALDWLAFYYPDLIELVEEKQEYTDIPAIVSPSPEIWQPRRDAETVSTASFESIPISAIEEVREYAQATTPTSCTSPSRPVIMVRDAITDTARTQLAIDNPNADFMSLTSDEADALID